MITNVSGRLLAVMITAFALLVTVLPTTATTAHALRPLDWVGAWTASPLGAGRDTDTVQGKGFDDQTVRNVVHLAAGGDQVRIEVTNAYGDRPLHVGAATVAVRTSGGAIDPTTVAELRFDGAASAVVAPGAVQTSDPVELSVAPGTDLAVSLHLPEPTGPVTWHQNAAATSYVSGPGDHTGDADATAYEPIGSWFFLSQVSVHGSGSRGAVVAFGDSITEGYRTTTDANHRYPDLLNARLAAGPAGLRLTALNAGIGGNRLLTDSDGATRSHESAQHRFVRDVVSRTGATTVIATFGTNDLASYGGNADGGLATTDDLIRGMQQLIAEAHAADIRIMVGTIAPFGGSNIYNERTEAVRQDYNTWVRRSGEPDAVADFDAALRDPADPTRIRDDLHSGDRVHPNDAGAQAMADAVDVRWLQGQETEPPVAEDYLVIGTLTAPQPMPGGVTEHVTVPLNNGLSEATEVTVSLSVPEGWSTEPVQVRLEPGQDANVSVPVTAPSTPTIGTVRAGVEAGSTLVLGQPALDLVTVPAVSLAALALDFGGPESPVLQGYRGVSPADVEDGSGFGWVGTVPDWRDRGVGGPLSSDFVMSTEPVTLRLSIPAGEHTVHVLTGDASYAAGRLVLHEGETLLADTDGKLAAGELRWLTFTLDGGASGRTVDLTATVASTGTLRLNALAVMA
ncbi:GDSL-type esterase/lipase family protein [Propionibacteriaceae bacterium Y2011]